MTDTTVRKADLRRMLRERRHQIPDDVQSCIRAARTDRLEEVADDLEHSNVGIQGDIAFAVLQMRAETR